VFLLRWSWLGADITNGSGTVTETFVYDVFGAVKTRTGTTATQWKFTGEQADDGTGDSGYYFLRAGRVQAGRTHVRRSRQAIAPSSASTASTARP
jgi:hypothetical protein